MANGAPYVPVRRHANAFVKLALIVPELARVDNTCAVMWGAEDLFAVTGGTANRWPDGTYRDVARHVRSQSLLAAKAYGRLALDSVYLDIADLDGLRTESDDAVAVGFDAKVAIHPTQVAVIRSAYSPTEEQIDWARRKPYDEFDYGYVLTVHKAQGSQWDDVVLFDESFAFPDSRERWLYTGVTRAAKKLTVVM